MADADAGGRSVKVRVYRFMGINPDHCYAQPGHHRRLEELKSYGGDIPCETRRIAAADWRLARFHWRPDPSYHATGGYYRWSEIKHLFEAAP